VANLTHRYARFRLCKCLHGGWLGFAVLLTVLVPRLAFAEDITVGAIKLAIDGPFYIAQDKGYFAAEGLNVEIRYLDSAEPIAVAVASGDIDFGATGFTGGLFALAGQGNVRIIAGLTREMPGFHLLAVAESKHAYEGGLRSFAELGGRAVGVSQAGSSSHYILQSLAAKYGVDMKTIRLLPLQGIPNMISAVVGGQADAVVIAGLPILPVLQRGDAKLLGWVGDEISYQVSGVFVTRKTAEQRQDTVERFLRAFRKGTQDYHDAFSSADDMRADGPTSAAMVALIAPHLGQSTEQVHNSIGFIDRDARLEVADVAHQIEWYRSEGMIKGVVDVKRVIDRRYVVPLKPE
jgi:NitT/TauT family transport system substrate-binding protein